MPYFDSIGAIAGEGVTLVGSGVRTATGNGGAVVMGEHSTLRLTLDVTAASGTTPSLTVNVQHSADGSTWTTHSSFAAKTAAGTERKVFAGLDRYARASWTISGTSPSFTFSVAGEAV